MENRQKNFILSVSIIALLLLCIIFFFLFREIKNNIKISQEKQIDLQKEIIRREDIKNFNKSFETIEKDKILFETHFAKGSDIVPFLNKIEKIASSVATKAEVSLIEVTKDNTGLILKMKDTGSFSQVYKFITLLENSPYELEFTSVNIHSLLKEDKNNTQKTIWEADLSIKLISFI